MNPAWLDAIAHIDLGLSAVWAYQRPQHDPYGFKDDQDKDSVMMRFTVQLGSSDLMHRPGAREDRPLQRFVFLI